MCLLLLSTSRLLLKYHRTTIMCVDIFAKYIFLLFSVKEVVKLKPSLFSQKNLHSLQSLRKRGDL